MHYSIGVSNSGAFQSKAQYSSDTVYGQLVRSSFATYCLEQEG